MPMVQKVRVCVDNFSTSPACLEIEKVENGCVFWWLPRTLRSCNVAVILALHKTYAEQRSTELKIPVHGSTFEGSEPLGRTGKMPTFLLIGVVVSLVHDLSQVVV